MISLSISLGIFGYLSSAPSSAAETSSSKPTPKAAAATLTTIPSTTSTTASRLEAAQKYYAAGDMGHALQSITLALRQEPSNATAHYLLANCLLKLGRTADASKEYYAAETLAPRSKIADYSRTARTQISGMQKEQTQSRVISTSDDDDGELNGDDKTSVAGTSSTASNTNDPPKKSDAKITQDANLKTVNTRTTNAKTATSYNAMPPGTLELIRQQAVLAKRMAIENGAAEAESERQKGIYEAKSLQEKAERNAARSSGSNEPISVSPEERERIKAEAALTGEHLKQIGNWKASVVEEWSHEKSDEIQRQAENLQEQLIDNRPSNMKLNPVGTNLYIRNYAKPPVTPMHAEIKSLSIKTNATLTSKQTSLILHHHAEQSTTELPNHRGQTVVKVEGKVLRGD